MHIYVVICFSNSIFCKKKIIPLRKFQTYLMMEFNVFFERILKKNSELFESSQLNQRSFEYFFG